MAVAPHNIPHVLPAPNVAAQGLHPLIHEALEIILPALFIATLLVVFVLQPTRVDGHSMAPALQSEQRLIIEKVSYRFGEPESGDVVVFRLPEHNDAVLVKRVIAVGGDVVYIREGRVLVNNEPYPITAGTQPLADFAPIVVPYGYVFVLGDNLDESTDSRTFGVVANEDLVGRAAVSYWPPQSVGVVR